MANDGIPTATLASFLLHDTVCASGYTDSVPSVPSVKKVPSVK